jgi:hypothetical protein
MHARRFAAVLLMMAFCRSPGAQAQESGVAAGMGSVSGSSTLTERGSLLGQRVASAAAPLPAILMPPAAPDMTTSTLQRNDGTPILLGIVGGVAGMFVGRWALSRGCEENCSEQALLGGMAGILVGAAIGYMVGGGELPSQGPPIR